MEMDAHTDAAMVRRFVERHCEREPLAPSFEQIEGAVPFGTREVEELVQELVDSDGLRLEWVEVGGGRLPVYESTRAERTA